MSKLMVGFGASTVGGARDSQGGFLHRAARQGMLRGLDIEWRNEGKGGETTRGMLARAERVASLQPHDIVVLLGCNDMPRENDANPAIRVPLEEFGGNLAKLLPRLKGERSLFVSSFPVSERLTGISPGTFEDYVSAALRAAAASEYDIWDLYGDTKPFISNFWSSDGTHITDQGHQFIAEGISRWLF